MLGYCLWGMVKIRVGTKNRVFRAFNILSRQSKTVVRAQKSPQVGTCGYNEPMDMPVRDSDSNPNEATAMPDSGDVGNFTAADFPLERYEPVAIIGKGTVGTIYLCHDRRLHRKKVAVKILRNVTDDELMSFQQEARATSRLNHRNIIAVYDFGSTESGVVYMAMEYVEGVSLDRELQANGPLDTERALKIGVALADALAYAHSCGIFHRDIKTSNILLVNSDSREPDVRLIDFGVAVIQHTADEAFEVQGRTIVGTPQYMSPDQCFGLIYDERSEVYSLGCVLFETLTGKPPFHGESALQIINKHASEKPPALAAVNPGRAFGSRVETLVSRCLAKNRDDRYQSMYNLKADLTKVLDRSYSITLDNVMIPKESSRKHDRDPVISAIMVALVCFIAACWLGYSQMERLLSKTPAAKVPTLRKADVLLPTLEDYNPAPTFVRTYNYGRLVVQAKNGITDGDFKELAGERDLNELRIYGATLDGSGFKFLNSPALERLSIKDSVVSDDCLKSISERKNLKSVEFNSCKGLKARGLAYLGALPLEALSVSACDLGNDSFETVSQFKLLTGLDFSGNRRVDSRSIQFLNEQNRIVMLSLSPNQIGSDVLREISKLDTMRELQFSGEGKLQAGQLRLVKNLPLLVRIVFRTGCASPGALKDLREFKSLERLELDGMAFGDDHLAALDGVKVKQLSLQETNVSSSGLKHLLQMPELQRVTIRRCLGVNYPIVNELSKQMKTCDIVVL